MIYAPSMVLLDSARRGLPVPALARWLLGVGIIATLAANVAHGWAHGPVGAAVAAWPAVALVGSYELLMWLIRTQTSELANQKDTPNGVAYGPGPETMVQGEPAPDQAAIEAYQASANSGTPLSERKLAAQFGRSRRWARRIIAAVQEDPAAGDERNAVGDIDDAATPGDPCQGPRRKTGTFRLRSSHPGDESGRSGERTASTPRPAGP